MIGYLEGTLLEFSDRTCHLLTAGGVGYEVFMPVSAIAGLPGKGEKLALFTHMVVREDALELYGFPSLGEREVFRTLISVERLGPKKALAILSTYTPEHLSEIVFREDADALAAVPGIGPKSSRQILWHLKDKLDGLSPGKAARTLPRAGPQAEYLDALSGMKNLGYAEEEVRPLLKEAFEAEPDLDASGAVRAVLKKIAAARA
jgi:Holliday junction DNA helicase RuvA